MPNPVSPKVTVAAVTSAVVVIVMYLLGQIPFVGDWPVEVKAALFVVVTGAVTWVAGYLTRDPLRVRLDGRLDEPRNEAGEVRIDAGYIIATTLAILLAYGVVVLLQRLF